MKMNKAKRERGGGGKGKWWREEMGRAREKDYGEITHLFETSTIIRYFVVNIFLCTENTPKLFS